VIAFYHGTIQFADAFDAFSWICIITDHVAQAQKTTASTLARVCQYRFERFEISVDITQDSETHYQKLNR
jgi:hypothetical protein